MIRRLSFLLVFLIMMTAFLAGCSGESDATNGSSSGKEDGEINLLFVSHSFVDAIKPLIPEFERETGIKVNYEVLAEDPAFEKLVADLSSGTGEYDVFMTSPLKNWQYITANWVEPLDEYISNSEKTPESWNIDDFVPGILNSGRWTGEPLTGVGEGKLWAIPINYESYNLSYRPSIMEKYNLEVPKTYEELADTIMEVSDKKLTDENGQTVYPVITRFNKYWDLTYLTFGTMLQTYGVNLIDEDGNIGVDSPESIEATKLFIQMLQEGSPDGAGLITWDEALQGFSSGQYLFSLNEADGFAGVYENEEESQIADDVGYAMAPAGPDGSRSASIWVWSLAMNAASNNKGEAWEFLKWATSKEVMIQTHLNGNMNPVRKSAWEDPEVAAMVKEWGAEEGQYLETVQGMAEVASLELPPHPEITRVLDIWAEAVQKAYFEEDTVENSLENAAKQIEKVLK